MQGTKAEYCIIPTLPTSIENIAAATGVPNIAEKAALIPLIMKTFLSLESNLNQFPR